MGDAKQHHYIPICYSKNFSDDRGFLSLVDLWGDKKSFSSKPKNVLKERYLYSQPLYSENRFDDSVERFFSNEVESSWTPIISRMRRKIDINQEDWAGFVRFISSMHIRVPSKRYAVIELLRESVFREVSQYDLDMPDVPEEIFRRYRELVGGSAKDNPSIKDLIDVGMVRISIDPHRYISSMSRLVSSIILFSKGFSFGVPRVVHNETDVPFVSSDNPVCFYSGQSLKHVESPYRVRYNRSFSFIFPISSKMILVNGCLAKGRNIHTSVDRVDFVRDVNRVVFKFANRFVFSGNRDALAGAAEFSDVCPRPVYSRSIVLPGRVDFIYYRFGRPKKIYDGWEYDIKR